MFPQNFQPFDISSETTIQIKSYCSDKSTKITEIQRELVILKYYTVRPFQPYQTQSVIVVVGDSLFTLTSDFPWTIWGRMVHKEKFLFWTFLLARQERHHIYLPKHSNVQGRLKQLGQILGFPIGVWTILIGCKATRIIGTFWFFLNMCQNVLESL